MCIRDRSAGGEIFTLKGAVVKSAGWRAVRGEPEEEVEEATLPELQLSLIHIWFIQI